MTPVLPSGAASVVLPRGAPIPSPLPPGSAPGAAADAGGVSPGVSPVRLQAAALAGDAWIAGTEGGPTTSAQNFQSLVVAMQANTLDLASLAFDPERIAALRAELRETYDPVRTQKLQKLIRLWDTWVAGRSPGTDEAATH
ncbi:hypothetical protein [uncultured Methylobacterium sp.]|uniref:hypothetical protein n=1 Tax=uncultured Methylobacterium sp. TaxID=157278 RepID=UPI0026020946|nr:hypothetical protein [uncultured Methylobacterium sp.]